MTKVIVCHSGCDCGCCGHYVEVDGVEFAGSYEPSHPDGSDEAALRDYAREMVTKTVGFYAVADIDWENCEILDD